MKTTRPRSIHDKRHRDMVALLTKARVEAGVSQLDLANAIGLRQPDISKIENNERRLDLIELLDIVRHIAKQSNDEFLVRKIIEKLMGGNNE